MVHSNNPPPPSPPPGGCNNFPAPPKSRRSRRNSYMLQEGASPRNSLRALAMLAQAASMTTSVPEPPPATVVDSPVDVTDIAGSSRGIAPSFGGNPDLNIPPAEAQDAPPTGEDQENQNVNGSVGVISPTPIRPFAGIPLYFTLPQSHRIGFQFNYNGGFPMITVRVTSGNGDDPGVTYSIGSYESMYRIYYDYSARVDLEFDEIEIKKFGKILSPMHSAVAAGVINGDILIAYPKNPEHNIDTHYKRFKIQDLVDRPEEVTVTYEHTDVLTGAYATWSRQHNLDPLNLIGFHRNIVVTCLHTMREVGIRNNGRLYLLPNNWRNLTM